MELSPPVTEAVEQKQHTAQPNTAMPAPKSSRQRFKPQLSCTLCRTRKLKCDRGHPCENCIKRDLASSCTFIHAGILRDRANHVQKPKATANNSDVHGRIKQLEELVVSFMQQQQQQQDRNTNQPSLAHSPPTGSESKSETGRPSSLSDTQVWVDQTDLISTSGSLGRLAIDEDHQSYVGGAHWAAILDSISSLKESVNCEERSTQSNQEAERNPPLKTRGPQLLAGFVRKATRPDILASMPPKSIADILIAQMFDSGDISITGVHCGTFRKEYEQFWADPSQTPIMWIGLLYAIMCLATNLRILCGNDSPDIFSQVALRDQHEAITLFSEKVVQCLILGNYTEPCQYTVPTLLTYSLTEHFRSIDAQVGGWMLMGLIIRAAMRLGYHREPSYYPNISVYQGEVRRRIWLIITHLDLHVSCQVGLPRMLREDMYDTQIPRNLLDSDFDENTIVLPPSRDDEDLTICGSVTMKHRVTMALGRILDQANAITPMSYDEIMKLDAELHEGYQDVPEKLRIRDLNALRHDRPELIVARLGPDLMFHKGRCILHRKYLSPPSSPNSQIHPYSIKSCIDSAMAILSRHKYLWDETRPGKSLYHYKWKTTTLATQDFLLAAMLLCLYLTAFMDGGETQAGEHAITFTRAEMLESLEISTQIFELATTESADLVKAAKAMRTILAKVNGAPTDQGQRQSQSTEVKMNLGGFGYSAPPVPTLPNQSSDFSSQTASSPWQSDSVSLPQHTPQQNIDFAAAPSYPVVDTIMNAPLDLNWNLWDNQFQAPLELRDNLPELWDYDSGNTFTFQDANGPFNGSWGPAGI